MAAPLFAQPVAHRGLHDRAAGVIENSRSAFAAAIAQGFAIECDLQLTRDGVPVLFHDDDAQRLLGRPGRVAEFTAADFTLAPLLGSATNDTPQRLPEFLEQIGGRALLQIELKHQRDLASTERLARATVDALATYQGPVTIESFDPNLLIAVRAAGFTGPRGIITMNYEQEAADDPALSPEQRYTLQHLLHWQATQFDFISCAHDALTLPAITFWRALGKPVTAWTIRSKVAAEAARAQADQIVFEGFIPDLAH